MNINKFFKWVIIFVLTALVIVGGIYFSTKKVEIADKVDLIRLDSPLRDATISSPVTLKGEARGNWFFEASFPIYVTDWDGKIIGQGIATAEGEWMTTEFVPFTAKVTFDVAQISGNYAKRGTLILKKDNPSGLPQYDDALEIPITFE